MSYSAHTWTDGETVTSAKMNTLENGISSASDKILFVNSVYAITSGSAIITYYDKSLNEVITAFKQGIRVIKCNQDDYGLSFSEVNYISYNEFNDSKWYIDQFNGIISQEDEPIIERDGGSV